MVVILRDQSRKSYKARAPASAGSSREPFDTLLTVAALNQAIALRQPGPGLIHHSDRGVQYASAAYVERLLSISAQVSMSAKGNRYDNYETSRTPRDRLAAASTTWIITSGCIRA